MSKNQIGTLDGTPEKRMFWSIISDYDIKTGITELIDNTIDAWFKQKPRRQLQLDVELDVDRQVIEIKDNAGGVKHQDLRLFIAPGGSKNSENEESIGIFGVGSKRAVIAIAEHTIVRTRSIGKKVSKLI